MAAPAATVAATSINVACTEVCAAAEGGYCDCDCGGRNHSMSNPAGLVPFTSTAGKRATLAVSDAQRAMFHRSEYSRDELQQHNRDIRSVWFTNGGGEDVDLPDAQLAARNTYISEEYDRINHRLRIGAHGAVTKTVRQLDRAIKNSTIADTMVVFRGMRGSFADKLETGDTITDQAFMSTAVDPAHAAQFSRDNTIVAVELPAGTRAVRGNSMETEYILPRGTSIEIVGFEAWPSPTGADSAVHVVKARLAPTGKTGAALVAATTINVPCTEVCQTAEGGSCTCSCGGRNHGFAGGSRVPYQSSASKALSVSMSPTQQGIWDNPSWATQQALTEQWTAATSGRKLIRRFDDARRLYLGPGHSRINPALRDEDADALQRKPSSSNQTYAQAVANLDELIAGTTTTDDVTVFRGLQGDVAEQLERGDRITDAAYLSTTMDPDTAAKFGGMHTMLMLDVPAGSHAVTGSPPEYELVLPRGSTVEVVGFEAWQHPEGQVVQVVKARYHPPEQTPEIPLPKDPGEAPQPGSVADLVASNPTTRGGDGELPGGYTVGQPVHVFDRLDLETWTVTGSDKPGHITYEKTFGHMDKPLRKSVPVADVVPATDMAWQPTSTADRAALDQLDPLTLDTLGMDPATAKAVTKTIKKAALTLDTKKAAVDGDVSDEQKTLDLAKHAALRSAGRYFGFSDQDTTDAIAALDGELLRSWMTSGGRSDNRDRMENAMQHLRNGGIASTTDQRAMLLQKAWSDATWRVKYGDTDDVAITRFVQDKYAARIEAMHDARGDNTKFEVATWPLTSWAVDKAGDRVLSRWIGRDTYAAQLSRTVGRDETWMHFWGERAFRSAALKAPGEFIVDDRNGTDPPAFTVQFHNQDKAIGVLRKTWSRYLQDHPQVNVNELAVATRLAEGKSPILTRFLPGYEPPDPYPGSAEWGGEYREDTYNAIDRYMDLVRERDLTTDVVHDITMSAQRMNGDWVKRILGGRMYQGSKDSQEWNLNLARESVRDFRRHSEKIADRFQSIGVAVTPQQVQQFYLDDADNDEPAGSWFGTWLPIPPEYQDEMARELTPA